MSAKKIIFAAIIAAILASCTTTNYYQICKVVPVKPFEIASDSLVYEDENCKVYYNFWGNGGNMVFEVYNKTDKNIYLNMAESFFILNGTAYDYYKNRVFEKSSSSSFTSSYSGSTGYNKVGFNQINSFIASIVAISSTTTKAATTSSGSSVSYNENMIVCIPSKSAKSIFEYNITDNIYRDCNLLKFPNKKQIKPKLFSVTESPFVFSNRIAYSIESSETLIKFENEFYVNEISNYPQKEVTEEKYEEFCGEKGTQKMTYFKNASADKFYIEYTKKGSTFKH